MHGNVYEEQCMSCNKLFTRQTHVPSLGAHLTGRVRAVALTVALQLTVTAQKCEECGGQLKDTGVDFGFYLPQASVENSR